tara:strand:- start:206 stop:508 length:303 start_codon:yes stop_codon:yes gene_type:complete
MGHLLNTRIGLKKIPKDAQFEGKMDVYVDLTIGINKEMNNYDQNVSVWISQSAEQIKSKEPKQYIGNGKVIYTDNEPLFVKPKEVKNNQQENDVVADLPF